MTQARLDRLFRRWNGERHALLSLQLEGHLRRRGRKRLALVTEEMRRVERRCPATKREWRHARRTMRALDTIEAEVREICDRQGLDYDAIAAGVKP